MQKIISSVQSLACFRSILTTAFNSLLDRCVDVFGDECKFTSKIIEKNGEYYCEVVVSHVKFIDYRDSESFASRVLDFTNGDVAKCVFQVTSSGIYVKTIGVQPLNYNKGIASSIFDGIRKVRTEMKLPDYSVLVECSHDLISIFSRSQDLKVSLLNI